jgi:TRAP-type C4-dicarboxylate transport system permease small subunit
MIAFLAYLLRYAWKNMILMHPRLDGALQTPGSYFHASIVVGFILMIRTLAVKFAACIRQNRADS